MALSRVKVWTQEVLTASDLNAEFNNIINNPLSLISPLTGNLDLNGKRLAALSGGTQGAPGMYFTGDGTTGIYSAAVGSFDVVTAGVKSVRIFQAVSRTFVHIESTDAVSGAALRFLQTTEGVNNSHAGLIEWQATSSTQLFTIAQHYVQRLEVGISAMVSQQAFTVQSNAVGTGANVTATLSSTGVWTDASSARIKDYTGEKMEGVFEKLRGLTTLGVYRGKGMPVEGEKHYSPTAEEFHAAFGFGLNNEGIAPKDVAWLAVKALMEVEQRIAALEAK